MHNKLCVIPAEVVEEAACSPVLAVLSEVQVGQGAEEVEEGVGEVWAAGTQWVEVA